MRKAAIFFYFLVFLIIVVVLVNTDDDPNTDNAPSESITVSTSRWLSYDQQNMMSVKFDDSYHAYSYGVGYTQSILTRYDTEYNSTDAFYYISCDSMPEDGNGLFKMPKLPPRCAPLIVDWLDEFTVIGSYEWWLQVEKAEKDHLVTSRTFNCDQFIFDDLQSYDTNHFNSGSYTPHSVFEVYPVSDFIPNKATEVLLVDIHDGEPYNGDIIIEQVSPYRNETHIKANPSGITSLYLTIQDRASFRIAAGDDILDVTFETKEKPFYVSADENQYLRDASQSLIPIESPKVRISRTGYLNDIIVDYFVGYAWIQRDIIPANKLNHNETNTIDIWPDYYRHFKDNHSEIVYARFMMQGFEEEEYIQTIPIIATNYNTKNSNGLNLEEIRFSAIYQDYIKISEMNLINEHALYGGTFSDYSDFEHKLANIYQSPELQNEYEVFAVASLLKDSLDNSKKPILSAKERKQFTKYLLNRLTSIYHPAIETIPNSVADDGMQSHNIRRIAWFFMSIWLFIGSIWLGTIARRIRIKRQEAWFDNASIGQEKGELPGAPIWLKLLIAASFLGAITSVYLFISHL